ncbi:hypothetical protein C8J57DRAFT_1514366 [Mycena rebaudengoi]|nr:hypothetical protein C8J57DRAFT_1514366 [Mycena rebaudengoi]
MAVLSRWARHGARTTTHRTDARPVSCSPRTHGLRVVPRIRPALSTVHAVPPTTRAPRLDPPRRARQETPAYVLTRPDGAFCPLAWIGVAACTLDALHVTDEHTDPDGTVAPIEVTPITG